MESSMMRVYLCLLLLVLCTDVSPFLTPHGFIGPRRSLVRTHRVAPPRVRSSKRVPVASARRREGVVSNNKPVYYLQNDGNVMVRQGQNYIAKSSFPSHHPGGSVMPSDAQLVQTNALLQNIPKGTVLGEINKKVGKSPTHEAYPHNLILMESPKVFSSPMEVRPEISIDGVIQKTVDKTGGEKAAQHPTEVGTILMELDMKLTTAQYLFYYEDKNLQPKTVQGPKSRLKRKALKFEFTYWPDGVIPYTLDGSFTKKQEALLFSSINDWMDKTCIRFEPARESDSDILEVMNGHGCNSFVGRIGGKQSLNLEPDCRVKHVMTHELGHVIGLIHEHQRPDRDDYITVATENVGRGRLKNYRKFRNDRISLYSVKYDYTSVMHYGKTAFSKDGLATTMITKDSSFQDIIGTASRVSFKDAMIVNKMYNCAGHCRTKPYCYGGYVNKNCQCVCPDGTQRCAKRPLTITPRPKVAPRPRPRPRPQPRPRPRPRTLLRVSRLPQRNSRQQVARARQVNRQRNSIYRRQREQNDFFPFFPFFSSMFPEYGYQSRLFSDVERFQPQDPFTNFFQPSLFNFRNFEGLV